MSTGIARGAAWMIALRLLDRLLGLMSTIVLARLLVPSDFGLIAMAMSFVALIELASAFSFDVALIQKTDPKPEHYDTAWSLNLGFALMCALATMALAPLAAAFYNEPRLTLVMLIIGGMWVFSGFENIGIVNFRRSMDFGREFRFMFGRRIAGFVVTLACALLFRSYWALIAGQAATRLASLTLSYTMSPYRPRLSLAARRDLFGFSGWLLISNVLNFALARLPHFVVGRVSGAGALGLYTMSSELAHLPSSELSAPINRAVFPGLSGVKSDMQRWRALFLNVFGNTTAVSLPASVGLAMLAAVLIAIVLGEQWADAVPVMVILALAGAVEVVAANSSIAYMSLGRSRLIALLGAFKLAALLAAALWAVPRYGVVGMAAAEFVAASVSVCLSLPTLMQEVGMRWADLWRALWRPVMATTVMALALLAQVGSPLDATPVSSRGPLWLVADIGVGAFTYVASTWLLWRWAGQPEGPESQALALVRRQWVRWRRTPAT